MAAIDPSATPSINESDATAPRATLKIIREPIGAGDDDEDEDDEDEDEDDVNVEQLRALLGQGAGDEDSESESEEDENGEGPSDPSKVKQARVNAIKKLLEPESEDEDMEGSAPNGVNGTSAVKKGKGKLTDLDEMEESDEDDETAEELEEFVVCTLDPAKNYQQPLDITVGEDERVFFMVSGTHDIYLTGNYVIPPEDIGNDDYGEEEDLYDLSPDDDEFEEEYSDEDELDDMVDPRVTELDEEPPKLIKALEKKGKNKRAAESDDEDDENDVNNIAEIIKQETKVEPAVNGEAKLSKKQLKKLKKNNGEAAIVKTEVKEEPNINGDLQAKGGAAKNEKKVQFAKNLEQGPTGSPKTEVKEEKKAEDKPSGSLGVKTVDGVKVDDRKLGSGPAAKKGDRVDMRYIGKLEKDGKVFDSNKKGKPFSFKLGINEVIKGWDIGVAGMSVGGERRITIPAQLGYGSKGHSKIPPNSTLQFDIKLLAIK
ncbi:MAG: peptidylprolyl isomerase fpr4 [Bogoriella megaspora]|nr:MAG: peptidylprolyl isomerase fpr4 [Bogoriella megaspora]